MQRGQQVSLIMDRPHSDLFGLIRCSSARYPGQWPNITPCLIRRIMPVVALPSMDAGKPDWWLMLRAGGQVMVTAHSCGEVRHLLEACKQGGWLLENSPIKKSVPWAARHLDAAST